MTIYKFSNFASSTLEVEISASATTLIIGAEDANKFPVIGAGEAFYATLYDGVNTPEIVECTARSGQNLTITRAAESTSARAWLGGTRVFVAMTAALFESIRATSLITNLTGLASGMYLKYNGTVWIGDAIDIADVATLQTELDALDTAITTHVHTAADVDSGAPVFTTVRSESAVALASSYNLNNLTEVGLYRVASPTNGPAAGNWLVLNQVYDDDTAYQEAMEITGADNKIYFRRKVSAAWSTWDYVPSNATVAAQIASGGMPVGTAAGTADALTVDFSPNVVFDDLVLIRVRCPSANTGTTPTLSQDLDTARTIVAPNGGALWAGAIQGDHFFAADEPNNKWILLNPNRNPATAVDYWTGTDTGKYLNSAIAASGWKMGTAIASAATITIPDNASKFHVTGTVGITDIDFTTAIEGREVMLIFDNVLTLTHNATTLKLPGNANITTAAGDTALVICEGGDNVKVLYDKADGKALVAASAGLELISSSGLISVDTDVVLGATYEYLLAQVLVVGSSAARTVGIVVSDDGTTFGTNVMITSTIIGVLDAAFVKITGTGVSGNKTFTGVKLSSNGLGSNISATESSETGVTHSVRFTATFGPSFGYILYGKRA